MKFAALVAVAISFLLSAVICPILIPFLRKLKFGQNIREEGPQAHLKKAGTPTMGGIAFLAGIVITSLFFVKDYTNIIPILFVTVGFGCVGFLDDYIKVVMKRSEGLNPIQKLIAQFVISAIFCYYVVTNEALGTSMIIPFMGTEVNVPILVFVPLFFIIMLGTDNGVNLTDGLDGLCTSVTILVAVFFTVVAIGEKSGIEPVTGAVVGSLVGFLIFNVHPAKVFMGDTGSLALGGFVASTAIMMKMPLFIVIVGFVYLAETLSVMLQVSYFKLTKGKRLFKMAPLHHHFELCGWSENKIDIVFSVVTALLCVLGYVAM